MTKQEREDLAELKNIRQRLRTFVDNPGTSSGIIRQVVRYILTGSAHAKPKKPRP